jgi:hypothetical protein
MLDPEPEATASLDDGVADAGRMVRLGVVRRELTLIRLRTVAPTLRRMHASPLARRLTVADEETTGQASVWFRRSGRETSHHPTAPIRATAVSQGWGRDRVEITPLKVARTAGADSHASRGVVQEPPPLVVRKVSATPSTARETDPARDGGRLRQQITETVERTVREVVDRRLEPDSRLGRRLTGQMRSQLYQDLVFERERLGVS